MRPDTLSGPKTGADWPLPAQRLRARCLICNLPQSEGRPVSPRKGMPVTWCCFGCVPRRSA